MQEPADGKDHVMPVLADTRADEVHANDVNGRDEPDDDEAGFGDDDAAVAPHVHVADEVVEPVAAELAEDCAEDWGDVDSRELVVAKVIHWDDKDGNRDVVADDPGVGKEVVNGGDEDGKLGDGDEGALAGAEEGVGDEVGAALLDAEEAEVARLGLRDGGAGVARVEGFVEEEDGDDQGDGVDYGDEPEGPAPGGDVDDKGSEEGAEKGGEDEHGGPDVDLARVLVEEVHVFDEHEAAGGGGGGEEAIEDAGGHVTVEAGRCGAPGGRAQREALEDQEDGETAEVGGPPDDEETAGTKHKDVTGCRMVDGVG